MDALRRIADAVQHAVLRSAMPVVVEAEGGPSNLSSAVEKSEPHYYDHTENKMIWKAKGTQSISRPGIERELVIKVVRGEMLDEDRKQGITKRLLESLKTMDVLCFATHPNIVPVYGLVANGAFIPSPVIPLYKNGDVLHYLANVPNANKYQLVTDVANALKFMHSRGQPVIHGNLKSTNILIDDDGHALISDIGIYTIVSQSESRTASIPGCFRWTAPEILLPPDEDEDKHPSALVSRESDVYAFGMTVLEIYTGKKPFSDRKRANTIVAALFEGKRPRRPESPEMTDDLWTLICDCWKEDPLERPSMARVHERLIETQDNVEHSLTSRI